MPADATIPRSRRSLLTAAAGGAAAAAAATLAKAAPVAAEGETMKVGGDYLNATSATQLKNTTTDNDVFIATSTRAGRGVYGKSTGDHGVEGRSSAPDKSGVRGVTSSDSYISSGVSGLHEPSGSHGELGTRDVGVVGRSDEGTGVFGSSFGVGVHGSGSTGGRAGVLATARGLGQVGRALLVDGRAQFSQSGVALVPAGADRVRVLMPGLVAESFVLATLQRYRVGVHVAAAIARPKQGELVIRLNRAVAAPTKVGYQVLEAP